MIEGASKVVITSRRAACSRASRPSTAGCPPSLHDIRFGRAACCALPNARARAARQSAKIATVLARLDYARCVTTNARRVVASLGAGARFAVHAAAATRTIGTRHESALMARTIARGGALPSARPKRISWSDGERSTMLDTRAAMRASG